MVANNIQGLDGLCPLFRRESCDFPEHPLRNIDPGGNGAHPNSFSFQFLTKALCDVFHRALGGAIRDHALDYVSFGAPRQGC